MAFLLVLFLTYTFTGVVADHTIAASFSLAFLLLGRLLLLLVLVDRLLRLVLWLLLMVLIKAFTIAANSGFVIADVLG